MAVSISTTTPTTTARQYTQTATRRHYHHQSHSPLLSTSSTLSLLLLLVVVVCGMGLGAEESPWGAHAIAPKLKSTLTSAWYTYADYDGEGAAVQLQLLSTAQSTLNNTNLFTFSEAKAACGLLGATLFSGVLSDFTVAADDISYISGNTKINGTVVELVNSTHSAFFWTGVGVAGVAPDIRLYHHAALPLLPTSEKRIDYSTTRPHAGAQSVVSSASCLAWASYNSSTPLVATDCSTRLLAMCERSFTDPVRAENKWFQPGISESNATVHQLANGTLPAYVNNIEAFVALTNVIRGDGSDPGGACAALDADFGAVPDELALEFATNVIRPAVTSYQFASTLPGCVWVSTGQNYAGMGSSLTQPGAVAPTATPTFQPYGGSTKCATFCTRRLARVTYELEKTNGYAGDLIPITITISTPATMTITFSFTGSVETSGFVQLTSQSVTFSNSSNITSKTIGMSIGSAVVSATTITITPTISAPNGKQIPYNHNGTWVGGINTIKVQPLITLALSQSTVSLAKGDTQEILATLSQPSKQTLVVVPMANAFVSFSPITFAVGDKHARLTLLGKEVTASTVITFHIIDSQGSYVTNTEALTVTVAVVAPLTFSWSQKPTSIYAKFTQAGDLVAADVPIPQAVTMNITSNCPNIITFSSPSLIFLTANQVQSFQMTAGEVYYPNVTCRISFSFLDGAVRAQLPEPIDVIIYRQRVLSLIKAPSGASKNDQDKNLTYRFSVPYVPPSTVSATVSLSMPDAACASRFTFTPASHVIDASNPATWEIGFNLTYNTIGTTISCAVKMALTQGFASSYASVDKQPQLPSIRVVGGNTDLIHVSPFQHPDWFIYQDVKVNYLVWWRTDQGNPVFISLTLNGTTTTAFALPAVTVVGEVTYFIMPFSAGDLLWNGSYTLAVTGLNGGSTPDREGTSVTVTVRPKIDLVVTYVRQGSTERLSQIPTSLDSGESIEVQIAPQAVLMEDAAHEIQLVGSTTQNIWLRGNTPTALLTAQISIGSQVVPVSINTIGTPVNQPYNSYSKSDTVVLKANIVWMSGYSPYSETPIYGKQCVMMFYQANSTTSMMTFAFETNKASPIDNITISPSSVSYIPNSEPTKQTEVCATVYSATNGFFQIKAYVSAVSGSTGFAKETATITFNTKPLVVARIVPVNGTINSDMKYRIIGSNASEPVAVRVDFFGNTTGMTNVIVRITDRADGTFATVTIDSTAPASSREFFVPVSSDPRYVRTIDFPTTGNPYIRFPIKMSVGYVSTNFQCMLVPSGGSRVWHYGGDVSQGPPIINVHSTHDPSWGQIKLSAVDGAPYSTTLYYSPTFSPLRLNPALQVSTEATVVTGFVTNCTNQNSSCYSLGRSVPGYYYLDNQITPTFLTTPTTNIAASAIYNSTTCDSVHSLRWVQALQVVPLAVPTLIVGGQENGVTVKVGIPPLPLYMRSLYGFNSTVFTATITFTGTNASYVTATPSTVTLDTAIFTGANQLVSVTIAGASKPSAKVFLHLTFSPSSYIYTSYNHPVPIVLDEQFYLNVSASSPEYLTIYGNADYVDLRLTLEKPLEANTSATITVTLSNAVLEVLGGSVFEITNSSTTFVVRVQVPSAQPTLNSATNFNVSVDVGVSGERSAWIIPPQKQYLTVVDKLTCLLEGAPSTMYVGATNLQTVNVTIEAPPKPGRKLILDLKCFNLTNMVELNSTACLLTPSQLVFNSSSPLNSSFQITVFQSGSLRVQMVNSANSTAAEFAPVDQIADLTVSALSGVVMTYAQGYTYVPSGKTMNITLGCPQCAQQWARLDLSTSNSLSAFTTASQSTDWVGQWNGNPQVTRLIIFTAQTVTSPIPTTITGVIVERQPSVSPDVSPPNFQVVVVPLSTISVVCANTNLYRGTNGYNFINITMPSGWNVNSLDPNATLLGRFGYNTNSSDLLFNGSVTGSSDVLQGSRNLLLSVSSTNSVASSVARLSFVAGVGLSFEYVLPTTSCTYTLYDLLAPVFTVDYNWYAGQTLSLRLTVPVFNAQHCLAGTSIDISVTTPSMNGSITLPQVVAVGQTEITKDVVAVVPTPGVFSLSALTLGSCFVISRTTPTSRPYIVRVAETMYMQNLPAFAFINSAATVNLVLQTYAPFRPLEVVRIILSWNATNSSISVCRFARCSTNGQLDFNVVNTDSVNVISNMALTISAQSAQVVPATFTISVPYPHNLTFNTLGFSNSASLEIPAMQSISLTSTVSGVQRTLWGTNTTLERVFYNELFNVTLSRPQGKNRYGVALNISMFPDVRYITLLGRVGDFNDPTYPNVTFMFKVLPAGNNLFVPMGFTLTQSGNLYKIPSNITLHVSPPTQVNIVGGYPTRLVCGANNSQDVELLPTASPVRDNVTLIFSFAGQLVNVEFATWYISSQNVTSLSVPVQIPCTGAGILPKDIAVNISFTSPEYVPAQPAFITKVAPLGTFHLSSVFPYLFRQQTMLIGLTMTYAPLRFPLNLSVIVTSTNQANNATYVDAESLSGALQWPAGLSTPPTADIELFGFEKTPDGENVTLAVQTFGNPEYEAQTLNLQCTSTCTIEVVAKSLVKSNIAALVVFLGKNRTFDVTVEDCAPGSNVTVALEPFEYENALKLITTDTLVVCGSGGKFTYTVMGVDTGGTGDPTPQPTQVLVTVGSYLVGARSFTPSQSLDMTIEIRRPAEVIITPISGQFIFFGRSAYLTIRLPRLPSEGTLNVTLTPSDGNITTTLAPENNPYSTNPYWEKSTGNSVPTASQLTRVFKITTLEVIGETRLDVSLFGPAAEEFYIGTVGNAATQVLLNRTRPWQVSVKLAPEYPEYFIGIPYTFLVTIEEPTDAGAFVNVTLNLVNVATGKLVLQRGIFFNGSTTSQNVNLTAISTGAHNLTATITGSESYDLNVKLNQTSMTFRNLLQLELSETAVVRYVGLVAVVNILSPPLLGPGYAVSLEVSWVGTAGSGSGIVLPVPSPKSYTFPPSTSTPTFTLTVVGRLPTVGRLKIEIKGSREFNTNALYVDMTVLSLVTLLAPPIVNLIGLVYAPIEITVSLSKYPPANTTYYVSCGAQGGRNVVVVPSTQVVLPNPLITTTGPTVSFNITPYEVIPSATAALITVNATASGTSFFSLDTLREVTFVLTSQPLLSPIVTANSIVLKPEIGGYVPATTTTTSAPNVITTTATTTATTTTLAPEADGSAALLFVEDRNAVIVNVTMPSLFRNRKPSFIRVSVSSADTSILTVKLVSPAVSTGIVDLTPSTVFPFYSAFQVTGVPVPSDSSATEKRRIRTSFILVKIESDTNEYESLVPYRFNVYPLHTFVVSNASEYIYSGQTNNRTFRIIPTSAPLVRSDGTAELLRLQLSCTCDSAVITPAVLTWSTMVSQDVTVWTHDSSTATCVISGLQTDTLGVTSRFELSPVSIKFSVRPQPQISLTLVVDDATVTEVSSKVVREKGLVFRITSTVAFSTALDVSLINDSYIPLTSLGTSTSSLLRGGRNVRVTSTLPLSTYRAVNDVTSDSVKGTMGTGFWRSVAQLMSWRLDDSGVLTTAELLENSARFFQSMDNNVTNATVALRWGVNLQRLALDVVLSPLPSYVSYVDEPIMILADSASFTEGVLPVSGKDRVWFTIIGETKPTEVSQRSQTAGDLVFASSSIAGALVFHGAVEGGKLMAVVSFSKCPSDTWLSSQKSMGIFLNPLKDVFPFMVLASEEDLGYYAGAIVNNILFVVIFALIHITVVFLVFKSKMIEGDFEAIRALLAFPGLTWFPLLLVYVPTTILSCRLLLYSPNPGIKALASFSTALCVIAVPLAAFRLVSTSYALSYIPPTRANVFQWFLEMGTYTHPKNAKWLGKYGGPIKHMRGEVRWFFLAEVASMIAVSVVLSANPTDTKSCMMRNIAACVLFFAIFFAFVILQPMSAKIDNFFFSILALIQAVIMAITTASADDPENSVKLEETVTTMLIVVACLLLVRGVLGWCVVLWGWSKACMGFHVETARRYGEEMDRTMTGKNAVLVPPENDDGDDTSPVRGGKKQQRGIGGRNSEEMQDRNGGGGKSLSAAQRTALVDTALSSSVALVGADGVASGHVVRRGFHKAFDPAVVALDRYEPPTSPNSVRQSQSTNSAYFKAVRAPSSSDTYSDRAAGSRGGGGGANNNRGGGGRYDYEDNDAYYINNEQDNEEDEQQYLYSGGTASTYHGTGGGYERPPVPSYEEDDTFNRWERDQML